MGVKSIEMVLYLGMADLLQGALEISSLLWCESGYENKSEMNCQIRWYMYTES